MRGKAGLILRARGWSASTKNVSCQPVSPPALPSTPFTRSPLAVTPHIPRPHSSHIDRLLKTRSHGAVINHSVLGQLVGLSAVLLEQQDVKMKIITKKNIEGPSEQG